MNLEKFLITTGSFVALTGSIVLVGLSLVGSIKLTYLDSLPENMRDQSNFKESVRTCNRNMNYSMYYGGGITFLGVGLITIGSYFNNKRNTLNRNTQHI